MAHYPSFNRTASSKQAVTVATPTVATISFAAATSSHDPNPILQSSDPDSDKTRSAATAANKLRHQELTFGARMRSSRYWQLPEKRNGASAGNEMLRRPNMRSRINTCFLPAQSGDGRLSPMWPLTIQGRGLLGIVLTRNSEAISERADRGMADYSGSRGSAQIIWEFHPGSRRPVRTSS
jgi:hypothetical protein